jgi:pyruvate/2-oxoglutarate dehydrogenase complex dihydrolipoamide acyltransferase (E2) component
MKGYKRMPLSFGRQMVAVSATVTKEKNAIHSITEVDITEPRKLIKQHLERTGTKLSFTSYIVCCLAKAITLYPEFNSFIKVINLLSLTM